MRAFKALMNALFDTLLPRRPRRARTESRSIEDIPLSPAPHDILGVRITTVMEYRAPEVQDLIRALKYDGSRHAAKLAADVLADYLHEELASHKTFSSKKVVLVPVPLHSARERERGWNQIALVLQELPAEMKKGPAARLSPALLERTRETRPQTRLPRSERLSNVAGAFTCTDAALTGTHVFLIDDVTTTGATLANAAQPLRRAGANVTLLALARA